MEDDILEGRDELGCLLMGHPFKSWWIGSLLDIDETRRLVPHQNATTLQVAAAVLGATLWMIENPERGVCLPDDLPHEFVLGHARPYLGPVISQPVDWTPLAPRGPEALGAANPGVTGDEVWQFANFLA